MTTHKVLITGGAGFIGFHVANHLLAKGFDDLTLIDNLNEYYDINLKLNRLKYLEGRHDGKYKFEKLDLTDKEGIDRLFDEQKFDVVINLAAQAGIGYVHKNPGVYISSNIDGFFNIIDAARRNDCKLVVYASSSSVYGGNDSIPFKESDKCASPRSLYAASKLSNEMIAESYKNTFRMKCIGLRFFNIYGPWGRPDAVYYKWSEALSKGGEVELRDAGDIHRDMTYIDDAVQSIEALMDYAVSTLPSTSGFHEVYNIGNQSPVRMKDLLDYLESKIGKAPGTTVRVVPRGVEEPVMTRASTEKLNNAINYAPSTPFQAGIDSFIDWYVSYDKSRITKV